MKSLDREKYNDIIEIFNKMQSKNEGDKANDMELICYKADLSTEAFEIFLNNLNSHQNRLVIAKICCRMIEILTAIAKSSIIHADKAREVIGKYQYLLEVDNNMEVLMNDQGH